MKQVNKPITGKKRLKKISGYTPEQVANLPALHPYRIGANLPTQQAENIVSEKMSVLCDATKRRGAGAITPGLPMILPSGRGAFAEFHELFTKEPEKKVKDEGKSWKDIEKEFIPPDLPPYKVVSMPRNFCIWCLKGGKDPAQMETGMLPVGEKIDKCAMKPGDVFLYWICKPCVTARNEEYKSKLKVVVGKDVVPIGAIKSKEHYNKLCRNIVRVVKSGRLERAGESEEGMRVQGVGGV